MARAVLFPWICGSLLHNHQQNGDERGRREARIWSSAQAPALLSHKELDIPGGFLEEETSSDPKQSHVEGAAQNPNKEFLG